MGPTTVPHQHHDYRERGVTVLEIKMHKHLLLDFICLSPHYGTLAPKISLLEVGTFHKCHHNQNTIAVKRHHHPLAMANYEGDEKTSCSLEEADP